MYFIDVIYFVIINLMEREFGLGKYFFSFVEIRKNIGIYIR